MLLGYCCINMTLRERKPSVYTNRTLTKALFTSEKASALALQNVKDLFEILKWNEAHSIKNFRISSELFPQHTNGELSYCPADLPDGEEIVARLRQCGRFAAVHGHVLSMHPGPFTCIASENDDVVTKSVQEVEAHSWIMDQLTHDADNLPVNINWHVGRKWDWGVSERFLAGWKRLGERTRKRCSIENDDKASGWTITKLYKELYEPAGIRLCLDTHHSALSREKDVTLEREFELAKKTWGGAWQEVHYSESANPDKLIAAHSDYCVGKIPEWLSAEKVYVEMECKAKELALLRYRDGLLHTQDRGKDSL